MVNSIKTLATKPFPSIPPTYLYVTLISFWHCMLAFSKGKASGTSSSVHPFSSITSMSVFHRRVAAP